jgi:hypothetical protein
MADLMISLGAKNAINLDGGGSATTVQKDTVISYVSDGCPEGEAKEFRCERPVATIICIYDEEDSNSQNSGETKGTSTLNADTVLLNELNL